MVTIYSNLTPEYRATVYPLPPLLAARSFVCRDGLMYFQSPRGDWLCIPEAGGLRLPVLQELHSTPMGWYFGCERHSAGSPLRVVAVEEYILT